MDFDIRIGSGYDIHRTKPSGKLVLGGVCIDADFGLEGHSDADVLTHAIIDALLGASSLGDIGMHFPDSSKEFLNANSLSLLKTIMQKLRERKMEPINVDAIVIAEMPRLGPYRKQMASSLSEAMSLSEESVSIKFKTNEKLGDVGEGKAIASVAVALIRCFK